MVATDNEWEKPLDEGYWQVLLSEGEYSRTTSPPVDAEGVLRELGAELLQPFGPISHLADLPQGANEEGRKAELASRIGENLSLRVIEVDREKDRSILSECQGASRRRSADDVWGRICKGEVWRGRITNLCSFGAFVDLGGVEGLIHISEMSWGRVAHPGDVLRSGEEVEVYVLDVDRERRRIALSLKRLHPDPWNLAEERYKVGQLIEGTITNVVSFGAFARVEEGLEGLIHISELAEGDFLHPRNVVKEGDRVTARILDIDSARHRLRLSLRQVGRPNEDISNSGRSRRAV